MERQNVVCAIRGKRSRRPVRRRMDHSQAGPAPAHSRSDAHDIALTAKMHRREFVKVIGAGVAGVASGVPRLLRAWSAPESAASQLAAFIDTFTSPSRADTPSDLSAASFAKELAETRAALTTLRAIDS